MRTPATFVVMRHLLSDPEANQGQVARVTGLNRGTISHVLHRLPDRILDDPWTAAEHMAALKERPTWKTLHFDVPNPSTFRKHLSETLDTWVTGQTTAAGDGIHIVGDRASLFVRPDDLPRVVPIVRANLGVLCGPREATVTIRAADPWMHLDLDDPRAPMGQRLFDYVTDPRISLILRSQAHVPVLSR